MRKQPTLEKLFALNADAAWVDAVNCYGAAIGASIDEAKASPRRWGPHPGDLSQGFRKHTFATLRLRKEDQMRYLLLADGMVPMPMRQADTAEGHIIAGCDYHYISGGDYHFFRRAAPHQWVTKSTKTPLKASYSSQITIANIHGAITDYLDCCKGAALLGAFKVAENRAHIGDKTAPAYEPAVTEELSEMLHLQWSTFGFARQHIEEEAIALGIQRNLQRHIQGNLSNPGIDLSTPNCTSRWFKELKR